MSFLFPFYFNQFYLELFLLLLHKIMKHISSLLQRHHTNRKKNNIMCHLLQHFNFTFFSFFQTQITFLILLFYPVPVSVSLFDVIVLSSAEEA